MLELPSICYSFERALDLQEMSLLLNWGHIFPNYIFQAFQNSSFDPEKNYETLETVGDSCLKLIVSLYLFDKNKKATEEDMTNDKVKLINNKYLGDKADALGLQFFVKVFKTKNLRFDIPYLNIKKGKKLTSEKNKKSIQVISHKILADVSEGTMGAGILSTMTLAGGLQVIKTLNIFPSFDFSARELFFTQSIGPSDEDLLKKFSLVPQSYSSRYADILDHSTLSETKREFGVWAKK